MLFSLFHNDPCYRNSRKLDIYGLARSSCSVDVLIYATIRLPRSGGVLGVLIYATICLPRSGGVVGVHCGADGSQALVDGELPGGAAAGG